MSCCVFSFILSQSSIKQCLINKHWFKFFMWGRLNGQDWCNDENTRLPPMCLIFGLTHISEN